RAGTQPVPAAATRRANGNPPQEPMAVVLAALVAMRDGDFSTSLPSDWTGIEGKVADAFNEIVQQNRRMEEELKRIGETVGRQGKTRQRASFSGRGGAWKSMEGSVNALIDDLVWPTDRWTDTIAAVAKADLSQTVALD